MANKFKTPMRVVAFCIVFVILFGLLNYLVQPIWQTWNNYNATNGIYKMPENTVETLFLGASTFNAAISPMEMYEKQGICGYNLATGRQPMLTSYYWIQEVYNHHPETLKTVVLDASELRGDKPESVYHMSLDSMKPSATKFKAFYDYTDKNLGKTLGYMIPLYSYHDRWQELTAEDFKKFEYTPDIYSLGYAFVTKKRSYQDPTIPTIVDTSAAPTELNEDHVESFDKIYNFCKSKNINILLVKTPAINWSSKHHNAISQFSEKYGVEFIDFSMEPYNSYINYTIFDNNDRNHLNCYGAKKLSTYLAKYLVDNYGATDTRQNSKYDFMKELHQEFELRVNDNIDLRTIPDLKSYLEAVFNREGTVFITIRDDGAKSFTDDIRVLLKEHGLIKFSQLEFRDSYMGIIQNGKVIYEALRKSDDKNAEPITYKGKLPNGKHFVLKSGSNAHGNTSACIIDGKQHSPNFRGINIIIYDHKYQDVVFTDKFDSYKSQTRDIYKLDTADLLKDEKFTINDFSKGSYTYKMFLYKQKIDALNAKALNKASDNAD